MVREEFGQLVKERYKEQLKELRDSYGYAAVNHVLNPTYKPRPLKKTEPILQALGFQEVRYIIPILKDGEDIDQAVYQQARRNVLRKAKATTQ